MKVKICGITNKDDAVWALNYGADYLGLNFSSESPRKISRAKGASLVQELPAFGVLVGVFVNADQKEIVDTVMACRLKGIQLHGEETPEFISALKLELSGAELNPFVIKAIRVGSEESLGELDQFKNQVDYFLLDTRVEGAHGGTGTTFDWNLAVKAKDAGKPIFLAGGLTPDNVGEAVRTVRPFGVDTASGVEAEPRKKDKEKMKNFIQQAKG